MLPDKIKGHHLPLLFMPFSRSEFGILLERGSYVYDRNEPFVDYIYNTIQALRDNQDRIVEIISGEKDFGCRPCVFKDYCYSEHYLAATQQIDEDYLAEMMGVEAGKKYSIRELEGLVNKNAQGWLDEQMKHLEKVKKREKTC